MAINKKENTEDRDSEALACASLGHPQVCAQFLDEGRIRRVQEPWARAVGLSLTLCPSCTSQSTVVIQPCTNICELDGAGASFPEGCQGVY